LECHIPLDFTSSNIGRPTIELRISSAAEASPAPAAETCRADRDFSLFVRWYREGKLKLDELVMRRYLLEQINDLEHGRILGRASITYA
jgi:Zn-dependent alcohol dehydrogenase